MNSTLPIIAMALALLPGAAEPEPIELLRDPHFATGFRALGTKLGKRVVEGELRVDPEAEPAWDLAQWSSRESLAGARAERADHQVRFANTYKAVIVGEPGSDGADLTLRVNGVAEYQGVARKQGEPWPHLLVSQSLHCPISLAEMTAAPFHLEAKLIDLEHTESADYSPRRHAAQYQLFITIQNRNKDSAGYGDFYWFGVGIFDDRKEFRETSVIPGDVGLGKLIYSPATNTYAKESTHSREWVTFDGDLLPEILKGLQTAWDKGFLKDSHELSDYRFGGMNLGWEVPGLFDCALKVRNLSIRVQEE